ncbi:MAG TPA: glycosyltransferase [Longimicrobiales bacterium]|jgi:glycosyltransferase involved in cell wall biosynthesis
MNVMHVSACCHLDSIGGTQRFQWDLAAELTRLRVRGSILWLTEDPPGPWIVDRDVPVFALASGGATGLEAAAAALVEAERPSLLHFHTWGHREARLAPVAREIGIPLAFTFHGAMGLCPNGTLLRWGSTPCDGRILPGRCGSCRVASWLRTPHAGERGAGGVVANVRSGLRRQRALRHGPGLAMFAQGVREFLGACSLAFVPSPRFTGVLTSNGARAEAIRHCPPGVHRSDIPATAGARGDTPREHASSCVVGYVGRINPSKGLHILLEGFMATSWDGARLRVVGAPDATPRAAAYAREMEAAALSDPRVSFSGALPVGELAPVYGGLSLLAIPSVGVETGPLVLLEALQRGVVPLASNRVGQPELARRHGSLVEPNTPAEWRRTLDRYFDLHRAREAPFGELAGPPVDLRTMQDVAVDVLEAYRSVLPAPTAAASAT